ncbi:MAG: fumarylacetoacetate hydrolase family protein [Defluviicoccus sp.]|nr:fumarylacetoacetate hydrolase family protein [Defluviicoccus sp.]MDE0276508.1 fumarylacetoacetate hydrolase family protein [Defluviicoccus sp.]
MNGTGFSLATYWGGPAGSFAAIVLGERAFSVAGVYPAYRDSARGAAGPLTATGDIQDMLEGWDHNFPVLQEIVAFIEDEGADSDRFAEVSAPTGGLRALPPVQRPGKILNAAQNFQEHVDEMIRAGNTPAGERRFTGDRSTSMPYLFLKASTVLAGANDDIAIPRGMERIDWEAEIACAIWKGGKRIGADKALDHVAGWMTTNDVSCRDLNMRPDRPALKSDWYGGKSHENFAPMGPAMVPKAFVGDHMNLFIRLAVNGETKQDGNTSQFIYTPEEQIEFASNVSGVDVGDVFVCGTCGGVGMGTGTFLKVGDVMETEVEGLGKMTNRLVEDTD